MGLKHLKIVQGYLKKNNGLLYNVSELAKEAGTNIPDTRDCLNYLVEQGNVITKEGNRSTEVFYAWVGRGIKKKEQA